VPKTGNILPHVAELVKKGYIKPVLETGKWRFGEDVEKLMGIVRKRKVVLYAGVSSRKDELAKQVKYLEENVKDHEQVITDVGSSLNVKRGGSSTEDDSEQRSVESRSLPRQAGEVRLRDGRGGMQSAQL
jgi:Predicted site-specific integrase-resolvase